MVVLTVAFRCKLTTPMPSEIQLGVAALQVRKAACVGGGVRQGGVVSAAGEAFHLYRQAIVVLTFG